jgi:hypothetical protein
MKCLLLIATASLCLLACSNDQKGNEADNKGASETSADCCKRLKVLDEATARFRNREIKKWARTKAYLDSVGQQNWDSLSSNAYFKDKILTGEIEEAYASWYISNYRTQTVPDLEGGNPVPVTEAVWVDRDAILDLAQTLINDPDHVDGIRIYFAKYPSERQIILDPALDPKEFSRKALVFVPTKDSLVGAEHYHRDYFKLGHPGDGIYIYDYNSLCPTKCTGAILGDHQK